MFRQFIIMILSSILAACSSIYGDEGIIRNRDTAYLSAESTTPLVIPPGLASSSIQDHYPLSNKDYPTRKNKIGLTPPELTQPQPVVSAPQPVTAQTPAATQATTGSKQRYLVDVFQHPEYLTDSFGGSSSSKKETTSTQTNANANNQQPQTTTQNTEKKRYIMDYFH